MANQTRAGLFWIRWEPRQWLVRMNALSPAAELAHRRLADTTWASGQPPLAAPAAAAAVARVSVKAWPGVLAELRGFGWKTTGGRLTHPLVHQVLAEARRALRAMSTGGRRGNSRRWRTEPSPGSDAPAQPAPPTLPLSGRPGPTDRWALPPPSGEPDSGLPTLKTGTPGLAPPSPPDRLPTRVPIVPRHTVKDTTGQPPKALNATEHLVLSAEVPSKAKSGEKAFMRDVQEALTLFSPKLARTDMPTWGGWWRNRYRENPDKATRVLADMRGMIRERRIRVSPGAAAHDLWRRLP